MTATLNAASAAALAVVLVVFTVYLWQWGMRLAAVLIGLWAARSMFVAAVLTGLVLDPHFRPSDWLRPAGWLSFLLPAIGLSYGMVVMARRRAERIEARAADLAELTEVGNGARRRAGV